ncbi:MAG TPA: homoserine kinase, partial [Thermomicrobiaceae bacterium]|nr:homoserine kinase [Thermomicrobiaceae bacterium]
MRIRARVPASSANLGPGFDTLAVALDLPLVAELETDDSAELRVVDGPELNGGDNLVLAGVRKACSTAGQRVRGGTLRVDSSIPVARGLGSSAAALVAGLLLGNRLCGDSLDAATLLRLAIEAEGHGDNVAAALFGGFVIVAVEAAGAVWRRIPVNGAMRAVVYVPERPGLTHDARVVVPKSVTRSDAVENATHLGLLVLALATGEFGLLGLAMRDRLHQPYRSELYPYLPE